MIVLEGRDASGWRGISHEINGVMDATATKKALRRPDSRHCTTQGNHDSNFRKDSCTFKDAIIHRGVIPNISFEISGNQGDLHTSRNGLSQDSVEISLKVILASGPNGKWDVKWAGVILCEEFGPPPHQAHTKEKQDVSLKLKSYTEDFRLNETVRPITNQPKAKPKSQVTAPKPTLVWAPRARGLEKSEKAVEASSSSPPADLNHKLGHDHVSVHS